MLREIKKDAQKFARVISSFLDVDVLIVDVNFNIIASTPRFFDDYSNLHTNSVNTVVGKAVFEKRTVIIRDKTELESCRNCSQYQQCKMHAFICVPIFLGGEIMGSVSIIMPRERTSQIFADEQKSAAFVESMADLMESKLEAHRALRQISTIQKERELVMDTLTDAYAVTDICGYITYFNRRFAELFNIDERAEGKLIYDVLPLSRLRELVYRPQDIKSQLVFHNESREPFYGFLSCTRVFADGHASGLCFRFRPLADARSSVYSPGEDGEKAISFAWAGNSFFPETVVHDAKRLAVTDKSVLIQGEAGSGKQLLARCMHDFSNRSDMRLTLVECYREYREHVPKSIFGIVGKLQSAHNSTVVFRDIERLPLSLQLELVDFLKRPAIHYQGGPDLMIDARLMFLSSSDLKQLMARGLFSDELYYRISENTLVIPPLRQEPELLRRHAAGALDYYKRMYRKDDMEITEALLDEICRYSWPGNLRELEACCDAIAFAGADNISLSAITGKKIPAEGAEENSTPTISQLEKQMIAQLLQSGASKEKIAQSLGISRATLYRKIKYYDI